MNKAPGIDMTAGSLGQGLSVGIGMALGVPLGLAAAARKGSWLDELIMRGNDLIFAFPSLVIAILITCRHRSNLGRILRGEEPRVGLPR